MENMKTETMSTQSLCSSLADKVSSADDLLNEVQVTKENMKVETIPTQSSYSFSADKVASCDDLLNQILFRLPVRSLLRCTSVSKHWYHLVSRPSFKRLRSPNPDPPSGLFVPVQTKKPQLEFEFVPFDIKNPVKAPFKTPSFDPAAKTINIEHSSNGLMLCSSQINDKRYKYYVYNPTINEFTTLPGFERYDKSYCFGMSLAFDPSISPHYKIIYVRGLGTTLNVGFKDYQIEMYSSQTRTCEPVFELALDEKTIMYFGGGVYWNNAIHWLHNKGFMLYFNLDGKILNDMYTPFPIFGLNHEDNSNQIFASRDHLLLVGIFHSNNIRFKIHELSRNYTCWYSKYNVDLEQVGRAFPEIVNRNNPDIIKYSVLSLVFGEKEDDPFLVLELSGKAVRFNLVSKTFHKLHDISASTVSIRSINFNGVYAHTPDVFQFRAPFFKV